MSQAVAVNDYDRFTFAFFMAALLHLLVIFGIGFSLPEKHNSATTLDVTLAQSHQQDAPDEADFLAQSNQLGSGTLQERAQMTSNEQADYAAEEIQHTQRLQQTASAPKSQPQDSHSVTTTLADLEVHSRQLDQLQALELPAGQSKSFWERSLAIASLQAKLDNQQQTLSKKPRTRRLTASSTRQSTDALYMNQWLREIETIGNLNYPSEAKRKNINGSLRLMVALQADGTIHEIKILESSGHKILDDAAKHIVRQASPFAPFSEEMRKETDVLEIIRTWQFRQTQFSTNI
ncbi:MAG: energy transducer TonB [Bermanella sp.]